VPVIDETTNASEPLPGGHADDTRPPLTRKQIVARTAGLAFLVGAFGMWMYAFFIYDPGLMIDELADRTFPKAAEQICAAAQSQVDALPASNTSETAAARADVIDQANADLRRMVEQLRAQVPDGQGQVTTGINDWLTDWSTYIDDRQAYADGLRVSFDTRFTESVKANRQISRAIDSFAQVNRMTSCMTPGDVG
jgi:hypothetical protein